MVYTLVSCADNISTANMEGIDTQVTDGVCDLVLVQIAENMYYDESTYIVYIWNGLSSSMSNAATMPSAYMDPNGLPYKYDISTKALVEIDPIVEWGLK